MLSKKSGLLDRDKSGRVRNLYCSEQASSATCVLERKSQTWLVSHLFKAGMVRKNYKTIKHLMTKSSDQLRICNAA